MKRILLPLLLAISVTSHAGNEKGNGGFAIQCSGKPLMILDYYEASMPSPIATPKLLSINKIDLNNAKSTIHSRFDNVPNFYKTILSKYQDILDISNWIMTDLSIDQDDTNTPYTECQKKFRVAYRQSGTVYLQNGTSTLLGDGQMFVLALHEWLYAASAQSSSETVRHVLREALKINEEFNQERFIQLITRLLSKWNPVVVSTTKIVSGVNSEEELDRICRANGAEFATYVEGKQWTEPNCGGDCTKWIVEKLTCAKLQKL